MWSIYFGQDRDSNIPFKCMYFYSEMLNLYLCRSSQLFEAADWTSFTTDELVEYTEDEIRELMFKWVE